MLAVPFKANAARRHRIPRQRHRVTNWAEYDAALRQRGSLTVWFTDEAVAAWRAEPRTTRGGQPQNLWRRAANGLTSGSLRDRPQEQSNGRCADAGTEPGLGPREHDRRGRGAERPLLAGGRAGGGRAAPMPAEARRVRGRAARPPGPP